MSVVAVGKAYRLTAKTGDLIQIGNSESGVFRPEITLDKWNREVYLKLAFDDSAITQKTVELSADDKVKWQTPVFDFHFYGIDRDDGGLELEVVFKEKLTSNKISFQLQLKDLECFYQPSLAEEHAYDNCVELSETYARFPNGRELRRPEDVVGSYSFFHKFKRGGKYKAGKAFHLYRPKAVDAAGKSCWCEYNRDLAETGVLTVTIPQDFLNKAVYPVVLDPTFGNTSVYTGTDNNSGGVGGCFVGTKAVLSEAGSVTKITAYVWGDGGSPNMTAAIYDFTTNALLGVSDEVPSVPNGSASWVDFDFSSSVNLAAGTYWLCVWGSSTYGWRYESADSERVHQCGVNYASYPSTLSPSVVGHRLSIYATYTAGAALQVVTDVLSLGDLVLRNKTLILYDSLGLIDALFGDKSLFLGDSASLSELITVIVSEAVKYVTDSVNIADWALTPSRVLQALDAVGLADGFVVDKVLQVTEAVSLVEIVEVGVGGVKKTRLFLILGDLAVQLAGD
jgi:hypothetical protein